MQLKTSWRTKTYISPPHIFLCKLIDWNKFWCKLLLNNQLSDTTTALYSVLFVGKIEKD